MSINNELLDATINNAADALLRLSDEIKSIGFPEANVLDIQTSQLSDEYISESVREVPAGYAKELKNTDFIYIFEVQSSDVSQNKEIFEAFCSSRNSQNSEEFKGKKDFCRPIHSDSKYLYVGRSKHLRSRLKQHLNAGSEGIFAMHMLRWCSDINVDIKIYYYKFDNLKNLLVQALEDGLWNELSPMLGRRGGR